MVHIAELKVKLKASMTLISSKLEPNLMLRNAFVPRESCLCPKAVIVLNDTTGLWRDQGGSGREDLLLAAVPLCHSY